MKTMPQWPVGLAILVLMLPVTAIVPVLEELTGGRHPSLSDFGKHLFMVANVLAAILFAPLAGRLSDRWGRRRPIIVAALLGNAAVLSLLALDAPYSVHLGLRFLEGALHITALTLLMTLALDRAGAGGTGRSMGLAGAALTLGVAAGAPLGGAIGQIGASYVLMTGAALSLALAAWITLWRDKPATTTERLPQVARDLPLGRLAVPYVFTFADRLSVGFIISTMTLYLRTVLGAEPMQIGGLMGAFMLPFALLTYPFGRLAQRIDALGMMMTGSLIYGVLLVGLAHAPLPLWWFLMPTGGVAAALMFAPSLVLTAAAAGDDQRALAMGGFHAAGSLGFVLGPLIGGGILVVASALGHSGWHATFWFVAAIQWLCVLAFLPLLARRRKPARPPSATREAV